MYLKELSSNKPTMKSLSFKPSSINIILGCKTTNSANKTVNGSGKTLSLQLIDFCLGANITPQLKKLNGWKFNLEFVINKNTYNITRSIEEHNFFILNSHTNEKKEFLNFMYNTNFKVNCDINKLSFRSLISRFLRIPPYAYNTWDNCKKKEDDEIALLNNTFLLDLDVNIVDKKRKCREAITSLNLNKKTLKNDNDLKEILNGSDIGVSITTLKKDINALKLKIENFNISEGYNEIKLETENMKNHKNEILNELTYLENIINSIDTSLDINVDITYEQVIQLYNEAIAIFPQSLLKTMEDVSNFHIHLLETRKNRLQLDKTKYTNKIIGLKKELATLDNKLNQNFEALKYSGTLSEYESLQTKLYDMRMNLYKMTEYEEIMSKIDFKINCKKAEIVQGNIEAFKYLGTIDDLRDTISYKFKEFVDFIYEESKTSGISISVNDKNNKLQFTIEPEIYGDKSEGINNVKIFCMDLLYLYLQKNHNIKFIYHDSTIFNGIDPRQVYRMMKLARKICEENKLQYIINLNYNLFDDLIKLSKSEKVLNKTSDFEEYIKNQIVTELFDDSPENTLLGFEFK